MKKTVFALGAIIFSASSLFAATLRWDAGDFTSDFAEGTGYLVQVTSGSTSIGSIVTHLKEVGLTPPAASTITTTTHGSPATVTEDSGAYYIDQTSINVSEGTYNSMFVIVLSKDQSKFAIFDTMMDNVVVNGVTPTNISFGTPGSTSGWTVGDVATVPEPTVLALLALGVAGVALRRKKVVA